MTQSNHLKTTEKNTSDILFQRKLWGVIAISVLAFLAYAYTLSNLFKVEPTTAVYIKIVVYVAAMGLAVASFILSLRRQVDRALTLIFYFLLIAQVVNPATTQGRAFNATFTMLVMGTLMIGWLLPRSEWRKNAALLVGAFILAWGFEWIDPAWRVDIGAVGVVGPAVAITFSIVLAVLVVREAWAGNLRTKLLTAFIGVTVVATGSLAVYVYISTNNILRGRLEGELTQHVDGIQTSIGNLLDSQINSMTALSLNEVLLGAVEDANKAYKGSASSIQSELDAKDAQWRAADAADNNSDPLVKEYLTNPVSLELVEFQQNFSNNAEIFITDVYGGLTGSTNRTSDYYQADEAWWQAAYNNGEGAVFIGEPEFDESANALAVQIALPLRSRQTGEIIGVLRSTYLVSALTSILDEPIGETGKTDLFVQGEVISHFHEGQYTQIDAEEFNALQAVFGQGMVETVYEGDNSVVLQSTVQSLAGNSVVDQLGWLVVFHQHQDEAFAPLNTQVRGVFVVMAIVIVLVILAAIGISLFLVRPILQLTQTAEEVAAGNLNSRAQVTSADEIGTLATTFNSMTSQLQDTLNNLEHRIEVRTKDLATVAEVSTATGTILEVDKLLQAVVDLSKERFELYHAHIYLLDDAGENLVLTSGAGEPGRQMVAQKRSIPLDSEQSIVARAARERKGVIVNDVTQSPDFLPNPLLPDTRAEMAVPMIVSGKVIGVFDVQSELVGRFTDADINVKTTLATQVATSIQNVRSFEQAQNRRSSALSLWKTHYKPPFVSWEPH